jgi:hypothetical protein
MQHDNDICPKDNDLTFRWMFKTAINNFPEKLRFQKEVSEAGTVYSNIAPATTKEPI